MKKLFIAALAPLLLYSCTDSQDPLTGDQLQPKTGQYIYEKDNVTAAVTIGDAVGVTVFKDGRYVFQELNGRVCPHGFTRPALLQIITVSGFSAVLCIPYKLLSCAGCCFVSPGV